MINVFGSLVGKEELEEIRTSLSRSELRDPAAAWEFLRQRSAQILTLESAPVDWGSQSPFVLLVIGVNGSGKTTTIGKLAAKFGAEGRKVMLAAGDTFRAAAIEQLKVWGERTKSPVIAGTQGSDSASLAFNALTATQKANVMAFLNSL